MLHNGNRYDEKSGYGENEKLERYCIDKFFRPLAVKKTKKNSDEQFAGIDYIVCVNSDGKRRYLNIDCKICHKPMGYCYFAYEYDDERENYKAWSVEKGGKKTDYIVYIFADEETAVLYDYRIVKGFFETTPFYKAKSHKTVDGTYYKSVSPAFAHFEGIAFFRLVDYDVKIDYGWRPRYKDSFYGDEVYEDMSNFWGTVHRVKNNPSWINELPSWHVYN